MRVTSIRTPWLAVLMAALLAAGVLGGIAIAEAADEPGPRSIQTTKIGDHYQRTKTTDCGAGCTFPSGKEVNCNMGDFATGGAAWLIKQSDGSIAFSVSIPEGTRKWFDPRTSVGAGFTHKLQVKCVDLTP